MEKSSHIFLYGKDKSWYNIARLHIVNCTRDSLPRTPILVVSQGLTWIPFHWHRISRLKWDVKWHSVTELTWGIISLAPCLGAERECQFNGTLSQSWPELSVRWHRVWTPELAYQFSGTMSELLYLHISSVAPCLNSWTCILIQWHRVSIPELAYQFSGTVSELLNLHISTVAPCLNSWTWISVQWYRVSSPELAYQFSGTVSELLNLHISSVAPCLNS